MVDKLSLVFSIVLKEESQVFLYKFLGKREYEKMFKK